MSSSVSAEGSARDTKNGNASGSAEVTAGDSIFDDAFLRRLERLRLLVNTPARGAKVGERTHSRAGAGLEFHDYRRYRPGDDIRHVDWNVSARLDQLFMKLYTAEVDTTLNILLDVSASMAFGSPSKFNYCRRLAAALAVIGLSNMDRISVTLFDSQLGDGLPFLKGKGHLRTVLKFLSDCEPVANSASSFTTPFADAVAKRASPGIVVVISDLLGDADTLNALRALRSAQHDVIVVQILTDEEYTPTLDGVLRLIDSESGQVVKTTVDAELRDLYQSQLRQHLQSIEQTCRRHGFSYVRSSTSVALEDVILRDLQYGRYAARPK